MNKDYRVLRTTHEKKQSFSIMRLSEDGASGSLYDSEYYVEGDSLADIRCMLEDMLCALNKPIMEEKREFVEI